MPWWCGQENLYFTSIKEPILFYTLAILSFRTCICAVDALCAHMFVLILKYVVFVLGKFLFSILCVLDRASSWYLNKGRPTWWHLLYYVNLLLNMFQMLIHPSSGACDYLLRYCVVCNDRGFCVYLVVRVIPILCVVCGSEWVCSCKRVVSCSSWTFYASVLMTICMSCTYLTWGVLVLRRGILILFVWLI